MRLPPPFHLGVNVMQHDMYLGDRGVYNVTHSQSDGLKRHDVVAVNSRCCFWVVSAWAFHPSPHIIHNNIPSLLQSLVTLLPSRAGCTEQMTPSLRLGGETLPHPQPLEIPNEALQPGGRTCFHGVFSVCTRVVLLSKNRSCVITLENFKVPPEL